MSNNGTQMPAVELSGHDVGTRAVNPTPTAELLDGEDDDGARAADFDGDGGRDRDAGAGSEEDEGGTASPYVGGPVGQAMMASYPSRGRKFKFWNDERDHYLMTLVSEVNPVTNGGWEIIEQHFQGAFPHVALR